MNCRLGMVSNGLKRFVGTGGLDLVRAVVAGFVGAGWKGLGGVVGRGGTGVARWVVLVRIGEVRTGLGCRHGMGSSVRAWYVGVGWSEWRWSGMARRYGMVRMGPVRRNGRARTGLVRRRGSGRDGMTCRHEMAGTGLIRRSRQEGGGKKMTVMGRTGTSAGSERDRSGKVSRASEVVRMAWFG